MKWGRVTKRRLLNLFYWWVLIGLLSLLLWKEITEQTATKEDYFLQNTPPPSYNRKRNGQKSKAVQEQIIELGQLPDQLSRKDELLKLVRDYCLDPPSKKPYNLKENPPVNVVYTGYKEGAPSWVFIKSVVGDLFGTKRNGFFVEAGAADGEYLSNTLMLEKKLNWTGLLVEVEAKNYIKLKKKNRKAWSAPVCLATKPTPHTVVLSTFVRESGLFRGSGAGRIRKNATKTFLQNSFYESFQNGFCVPAHTLLEALNVHHVDFFSLDVEEVEMDILRNFPFGEITVDVLAIEHLRPKLKRVGNRNSLEVKEEKEHEIEDRNFIEFMEKKGYYLFDMLCDMVSDYIFIRRESAIFEELKVPQRFWKRRGICLEKGDYQPEVKIHLESLRDRRHWPVLKFKEESPARAAHR